MSPLKTTEDIAMESKLKYTADIFHNNQALDSHSSNNFDRLMVQIIHYLESFYPNATGTIRDNENGRVIQTYRIGPYD